jgi:hypothetical protein
MKWNTLHSPEWQQGFSKEPSWLDRFNLGDDAWFGHSSLSQL